VRAAIRSIDAASPCPELETRKRAGRPFMVSALYEPLMTRGASRRPHRIRQMADATSGPARYFGGDGLCDCSAHEQFPKEPVNRALLKVGPAAAWRMSCRRSVGGRGHGRVISCRVHLDAAHQRLMIAQGLHEKARPAEKTLPGISNLMNAKLVSDSTWASPRRDGEG
jgi:hypothetical protein